MEVQLLVAWNLRRLRVERGISQDDLAYTADIERAYVGRLEQGQRNPTVLTLDKLANALSVHISELFKEPSANDQAPETLKAGRKRQRTQNTKG